MPETTIPGIKAKHCFITDTCRQNRTDEGAIDEALARIRAEFMQVASGWDVGNETRFHVVLTVEK